ncbi:MAG: hypothetical protein GX621_07145, partial [Pirellulaceae bacterium]|nr:hypothetical protein [Pirellulaceae bacterium]
MRLTLRTLLAYLDDILEPEDAENIGRRIQESEVASALLHRIRDVMRRLRLQAPKVEESDKGLDPNTVAEYLDHVLPDDRVPDFERNCLESDMHLAEVASCHQILALVVGEPAEVDPTSREHMYAIPQVAADLEAMEARQGVELAESERSGAAPPPPPRRPRPVVPDYLRESKRRRRFAWPVAAVVLIGLVVVGWFTADHFGLMGGGDREVAVVPDGEATKPAEQEPAASSETPEVLELIEEPPVEPEVETETPVEQPTEQPTVPDEVVLPPGPNPEAVGPAEVPESTVPAQPAEPNERFPTEPVLPPEMVAPATPPDETRPSEPAKELVEQPAEPATPSMGRFVSDVSVPESQLLLQRDPETEQWILVPPQGIVVSGHRFLSLPAFRPLIALTAGLTIHLKSGTQIYLETSENESIPYVDLEFGRMEIRTIGTPDTRLRLNVDGRKGTLVFVDPESRAAIEIQRELVPGADPGQHPPTSVVSVHALSGRLIWESDDGLTKIEFKTPSRLTLEPTGTGPAVPVDKFPPWIVSDSFERLDRRAAKTLLDGIRTDRPVDFGLKEQLDHRQREVRWLAARCLGYLGEFAPLAAGLNLADARLLWDDYIGQLREALARGPEMAERVRDALEDAHGSEGSKIYRMLWGYDAQQLVDGQDAALVDGLGSDILALRVVSFWNLKTITGGAQLYYRPDLPLVQRQKSIQAWEKRQKNGEIRIRAAKPAGGSV